MVTDSCEEERMVIDLVESLVANEVAPRAAEIDERGEFPWEVVSLLGHQGLFGIVVPAEYGGTPTSFCTYLRVVEKIASACGSTSIIYATQAHSMFPILAHGTEAQKMKYLPDLASAKTIGALGITEPEAGSDVGSIRMTAVRKGDRYVLNGTKRFITSGNVAGTAVVFARTGGAGAKGLSAFIVERNFPGFSSVKVEKKMGIRGSTTAEIVLEDCEVPAENLLGEEGKGFAIVMKCLDKSRPSVAAQAVGIAQGAFDAAVRYVNERKQFGKRVLEFQGMQFLIADMATQIEAARSLVMHVGGLIDAGCKEYGSLASMSKLYASDMAVAVTGMAIQAFGGYGYMKDYPVERFYRDAKVTQLYEGTNQIHRMIIGRGYLER